MAISLAFGIPAALALDRANFPGKALFRRLVLLPLILPGIITGLSLLMLFREADVKLSLLTIVLGHGTALISVATTEVFAGLQKLDRAQEEASLDLGANYWQTFWRVTLPNLRLSIIGAALLIFTLSMDEIAVSFFLIGRDNTLPLEIWGRLRRGITPEINAISSIIFVFSLAAIVTWYRLRAGAEGKRGTRRPSWPRRLACPCNGGRHREIQMTPNRRDFIKFVVAGSVAAGCPIDLSLLAAQTADPKPSVVEGEDNHICHQVRDGKIFARPPVSARHDVVIVGGGVSGLAAAYRLRDLDFLLLEKEPHWGGNAYLMEYQGTPYATGSAFLGKSEHAYDFAREIGLEPLPINDSDSTIVKGEWIADTWRSGLDKLPYPAAVRESFKKFRKELLAIDLRNAARNSTIFRFPISSKGIPTKSNNGGTLTGLRIGAQPATKPRALASMIFRSWPGKAATITTPGPEVWAQSRRSCRKFCSNNLPVTCGLAPRLWPWSPRRTKCT